MEVSSRGRVPKGSLGLWDTRADPAERRDLSGAEPKRDAACRALIESWIKTESAEPPERSRVRLTDETRKQLEALGYLR